MYLDVRIPWEPGKKLGLAYNRMMTTVEDWCLILDWDVTLLNKDWYDICLKSISKCEGAGLLSCLTNKIWCKHQKVNDVQSDNIIEHVEFSNKIQKQNKGMYEDVTNSSFESDDYLSGMFFLTRRKIWDEVGGAPPDMFLGLDNWYHEQVKRLGYKVYVIKELYVYHRYLRQWQ